MQENYDIIVAGAGLSGSLAAAMAAKNGAKVILLDRNKEEVVGKKTNWGWTCGDAVADSHLKYIKSKVDLGFSEPELDLKVDGVVAFSPDFKSRYLFDGEGYTLDRPAFERKLLKHALKEGSEYESEFEVEGPIMENNFMVGIFGKDKNKEHKEIRAKVVIDALGIATTLRRKIPENPYVDREVDINDVESTGRFIYEFELDHEDLNFYDEKNAIIHLNQHVAPGGYGWVFPKSKNKVNIGLGVQRKSLELRNQKLGRNDNLHMLIDEYVKTNPVLKNLKLYNADNNGKGYWSVAVRRQLPSLVFNGYMGAGDSMAMPNPISAGGIGPALVAGILAGEDAALAVQNGDTSINGLWKYNTDFNEEYGKKTAGLEVFRVYLQSLNNDLLNYGMKMFVSAKDATDLGYGLIPELSIANKFKMILKGAENINAFSNLLYVVKKMKALNELYGRYPKSTEGFPEWRRAVDAEMEEAKSRFKPNPI
ncbi:MAG: NAD(P)/FAD-dependent oxidoreductase [Candidatus Micrarchaeota archaeon]|nr:NAD(P)/FAD-dependent oxidoreductase [Candidatus Micrarchaeota archaeon]